MGYLLEDAIIVSTKFKNTVEIKQTACHYIGDGTMRAPASQIVAPCLCSQIVNMMVSQCLELIFTPN